MYRSSKVMPQDPLNIDIPGVEFKVDNNGIRQIVSLPEQFYTDIGNGHGYVDLGLSVKWATCNIGADSPEKTGGKYAWGEVATKPDYTWQSYRFNNGGEGYWDVKLSKYNSDSKLGPVDMREALELEDDAAHVNWGGNWRIPTAREFQELANNCTFVWSTLNGCEGCLIVSNIPGYTDRFIFLPATRKRTDGVGTADGYYWSSTTNLTDRRGSVNPGPCSSYAFFIWNMYNLEIWINLENQRSFGLAIRPVCTTPICKYLDYDSTIYNTLKVSETIQSKYHTPGCRLEPDDDAAHVNWGGGWRMPTKEEFAELFEKCEWADTIQKDVFGFLFTSKVPGYTSESIFLP